MSQPTEPQAQPRPKKPNALPSNRPAPHSSDEAHGIRTSAGDDSREDDAEAIDDADVIETEDVEPQAPETD
ncbi:MAG: hypothetical protein ACRELY_02550 [Polyangiaceae bacterium]